MSGYENYTLSPVPWIKQMPEHWGLVRGKNLYQKMQRPTSDTDEVVTCFRDGTVTLRKNRRTTGFTESLKEIGYQGIRKGDLVIHVMDAFAGSIGVSDSDGKGTPVYSVCQAKGNSNNQYYALLLREMARSGYIQSLYRGIRERSSDFRFEVFAAQFYPVPPREEQDQIVRFLDWKVSSINKLINIKKKEIEAIDALKRSTVSHAITRGLTADAPMKYSGVKWLGDIPQRWYTVPLYAIAQVKSINNCIDLPLMSVYLDAGVVPFVEREEKRTNATSKDLTNYQRVDPGDFVLNNQQAWRGSVGVSFHSGIVSPAYIVLSLNNTLDSHYANYLFRSRCMVDQYLVISRGVGSIQRNLYWSALKRVVVPIPSKKEQMEIVEYLDGLNNKFDATIKKLTEEVAVLEEYKNKIIADIVTGKIDVRGIEIPEYEFVDEDNDNVDENLEQGADEPPEEE